MDNEYTYLVWNTNRKTMYKEIANAVEDNDVDFLVLIENNAVPFQLIEEIEK